MYIHSKVYIFLIIPFGNLEKVFLNEDKAKEMTLFYYIMVIFSKWI